MIINSSLGVTEPTGGYRWRGLTSVIMYCRIKHVWATAAVRLVDFAENLKQQWEYIT